MQIIETLEAMAEGEEAHRGLIVANDADYRRARALTLSLSPTLTLALCRVQESPSARGSRGAATRHTARGDEPRRAPLPGDAISISISAARGDDGSAEGREGRGLAHGAGRGRS